MMFFGRKEAERVAPGALQQLLASLFNGKLAQMEQKASAIVAGLKSEKDGFAASCTGFEKLDAEPDTEDMWNPNVNAIKTQKSAYSTALRNVIAELDLECQDPNIYTRYRTILSRVEATVDKVLKANANFKTVLYCYSRHLREFKTRFSSIERLRDSLRAELDRRLPDYETYVRIGEDISKLASLTDELATLGSGIAALTESAKGPAAASMDAEERSLSQKLEAESAELSSALKGMSELSARIGLLTAPLAKASRKFDHDSRGKEKLSYFVENPVSNIKSRQEYDTFLGLVAELKAFIKKSAEIKDKDELLGCIENLEAAELYSLIDDLSSLKSRKSALESDIWGIERTIDGLKAGRNSMARSAQEMVRMDREVDGVTKYRATMAIQIEKSIMDSYGKQISIAL